MPFQLFLSHDSRDQSKADVIAQAIQRITLRQIEVWHSSDMSASGGLRPGNVWLDEIRNRLAGSRAVVALLTPTSIARPWLLFESGFGAAQPSCDVIPVCVGIDSATDVPYPLAMYQAYQLSDYDSLKRFAAKLCAKYEILFDEEMSKPVLREAIGKLVQASGAEPPEKKKAHEVTLSEAIIEMKEHMDKRLIALYSKEADQSEGPSKEQRYNVAIDLNSKTQKTSKQYFEIGDGTTVQDVLDVVYFMLDDDVEARTYLEQWVLRDVTTREHLIVREIQYRIPAKVIFTPASAWEVIRLAKPYVATNDLALLP